MLESLRAVAPVEFHFYFQIFYQFCIFNIQSVCCTYMCLCSFSSVFPAAVFDFYISAVITNDSCICCIEYYWVVDGY